MSGDIFDCSDEAQREAGLAAAAAAVLRGALVVLPTEASYGIGVDAFRPAAVTSLMHAKGAGPAMPPAILVGSVRAASALVQEFGPYGQELIDEFWPGGLTLICRANKSLRWDLGETKGTVSVRMPDNQITLGLLEQTGPMAVSSAKAPGADVATTVEAAVRQFDDVVEVYLDAGPCEGAASTIIDMTGDMPRLLRAGAVPIGRLRNVAAVAIGPD